MDNSENNGSPVFLILILLGVAVLAYLLITDQLPGINLPALKGSGNPFQGILEGLSGIGKGLSDLFSGFFR